MCLNLLIMSRSLDEVKRSVKREAVCVFKAPALNNNLVSSFHLEESSSNDSSPMLPRLQSEEPGPPVDPKAPSAAACVQTLHLHLAANQRPVVQPHSTDIYIFDAIPSVYGPKSLKLNANHEDFGEPSCNCGVKAE